MKIIRSEQVKLPENQPSGASLVQDNIDSGSEVLQTQQRERLEMKDTEYRTTQVEQNKTTMEDEERKVEAEDDCRRSTEAEEKAREEEQQRVEEERRRREAKERRVKAKRKEEQKRQEMKVVELEGKIRSCR